MKIDGMKNNVGMRASIPEMRKDLRGSVTPMKTADMPKAMADPFFGSVPG